MPCAEVSRSKAVDVELFDAPSRLFSEVARRIAREPARDDWFRCLRLPDGSDYLRWSGLFEFVVSTDGKRIGCRALDGTPRESFHAYLLGQVLSFALIRRGIEPLHSTAVVVDGGAVGFVGDCGYGKSSLGAALLQAGHPLLTDDLLVLKEEGPGLLAYPGPPRIKLFPNVAKRLLGGQVASTPMNPLTPKLVISLPRDGNMVCQRATPLKAIYVLAVPARDSRSDRISIRPLPARRAFVELIRSTFNAIVLDPARLARQFDLAARLARRIPVRSLSFPRRLGRLPAVREAILSDLAA